MGEWVDLVEGLRRFSPHDEPEIAEKFMHAAADELDRLWDAFRRIQAITDAHRRREGRLCRSKGKRAAA